MIAPPRSTQHGVALILVLMVTAVLGLLILQISLTAKEHTSRAQRLLDRAEVDLKVRSANAELLFSLATNEWGRGGNPESSDPIARIWRFDAQAFPVEGVEIRMQDLSGLLPAPQPGGSVAGFDRALRAVGVLDEQIYPAMNRLADSQAPPGFVPLQHFQELAILGGLDRQQIRRLDEVSTLYPARYFNPSTATDAALAARFSGSVLAGLRALREQNRLDAISYFSLTGEGGDESISFLPGPGFRIRVLVTMGDVSAAEELSVTVDPYASRPFLVWSRRRPEPPADPS